MRMNTLALLGSYYFTEVRFAGRFLHTQIGRSSRLKQN